MKRFGIICVLVVMSFVVLSAAAAVGFARDKTISLRYAGQAPAGDPISVIEEQWGKEIEKWTNGKVKVRYYPAATLSSPIQMYENVLRGVIDIGSIFPGYTQGRFPQMQGLSDMPFEWPNNAVFVKVVNQFYAKFKPKEFDEVAVMYFSGLPPPAILLVKKPWVKIADLKGLKIRTMGPNARLMSQFGATPIAVAITEVYDAASKGMVEACDAPYTAMKQFRLADIMKYVTEYKGSTHQTLVLIAMNKNKWNSIPAEQQKIIEQINREWSEKHTNTWASIEKEAKEYTISRGVKINKLSAEENEKWLAKARPLFDEYVAQMKKKNLPGEEVIKFVRDMLKQAK